jgi:hypothetical protein
MQIPLKKKRGRILEQIGFALVPVAVLAFWLAVIGDAFGELARATGAMAATNTPDMIARTATCTPDHS